MALSSNEKRMFLAWLIAIAVKHLYGEKGEPAEIMARVDDHLILNGIPGLSKGFEGLKTED